MKTIRERLAGIGDALRMRGWWILACVLVVLFAWPGQKAYVWVAWNWWFVPYQAACRDVNDLLDGDIDDLHLVTGDLSQEFWEQIGDIMPTVFPGVTVDWREDGVLMVPRGFTFPIEDPFWSHSGQEPEERAHRVAANAAFGIYNKRLTEGVNMGKFFPYIESHKNLYWPNFSGPSPDVCGMMEKLVLKGGELSRPGPGTGAGR